MKIILDFFRTYPIWVIVTSIIITLFVIFLCKSKDFSIDFSLSGKVKALEESYSYFTERASDKEKLIKWVDLYYQKQYSKQRRWGTYDCSSAIINYLNSYGANFKDENVEAIKYRIERLSSLNLITIKKAYKDIQLWDLIIFSQSTSGNYHIGIIYDKLKGNLGYLDMNGTMDTMGAQFIKFNDYRIDKIVGISFALWSGDILERYK